MDLLPFILTCIIIEATPGPNMAYLAILGASEGKRAGLSAVLGIAVGLLLVGLAASFGVAALITSSALAYEILRWGGVFYLLWLAWDGWQTKNETSPAKVKLSMVKYFKRGLMTNLLNPKAAVFYIAILPSFTTQVNAIWQTINLTFVYVLIATFIHSMIVVLASQAKPFLENPARQLMARRILSFLLALIALWFAWSTKL